MKYTNNAIEDIKWTQCASNSFPHFSNSLHSVFSNQHKLAFTLKEAKGHRCVDPTDISQNPINLWPKFILSTVA